MTSSARLAQRLRQAVGQISTTAVGRIESELPWFGQLSAQERAWISMIVQGGVGSFVDWYAAHERESPALVQDVFGSVPRAFAGTISLQRTVEMVRLAIAVVEECLPKLLGNEDPETLAELNSSVTRYGREIGFAIAEVYARAAEMRGAWDARLEALVVDSVLRGDADDSVASRASALGWTVDGEVVALVGGVPEAGADATIDHLRRTAHEAGLQVLCGVQGERLMVFTSGVTSRKLAKLAPVFGPGPVVVGPVVGALLDVRRSATAALSGHRAADAWPGAPRPVNADDLLPERALLGDQMALDHLVSEIYDRLHAAGSNIAETVASYYQHRGSLEGTARALFVHANTVRYRLRRAHEVTGLDPADPRDGYTLRIALTVGALQQSL